MDRSIVRPVLDAINAIRSSRRELAVYYRVIDLFCARWLGKPRSEMSLEDDEAIYLAHELLREFLRYEGNTKRVALWLLTINRCCRNIGADLSVLQTRFARAVEGDLDFDPTLLSPILDRVRHFESRHSSAVTERLGERDAMGPFYQWIGVYCTYVYPRLRQDARARDKVMVSTLVFLISQFISLRENVSRMAALLLAIREACAYGRPSAEADAPSGTVEVAPGTETEIVEQILDRLRAESARPERPQEERIRAMVEEVEGSAQGALRAALEKIERWGRLEIERDRGLFARSIETALAALKPRPREAAERIAAGFRENPRAVAASLEKRLASSSGDGRRLLSRLIVLGALLSLTP